MLRIIWRKLYAPLRLFDDMKLVAFLQFKPRKNVLGQYETERITDLLNLNELTFNRLARHIIHDSKLRYTERITRRRPPFNRCFTSCEQSAHPLQLIDHARDDGQPAIPEFG